MAYCVHLCPRLNTTTTSTIFRLATNFTKFAIFYSNFRNFRNFRKIRSAHRSPFSRKPTNDISIIGNMFI